MENKKYDNEKISEIDNSLEDIESSIIKQNVINELNFSFRAVLSYGTANELIPNGQFIIKDIVKDKTTNSQNLILEQIDSPSINLIVPRHVFVQFVEMAVKNSKNLNVSEGNPVYSVNKIEESAASRLLLDKSLTDLQESQVLPLEENKIILLRDDKEETANYSLCPIYIEPLQKYLEKERYNNSKENDGREI